MLDLIFDEDMELIEEETINVAERKKDINIFDLLIVSQVKD